MGPSLYVPVDTTFPQTTAVSVLTSIVLAKGNFAVWHIPLVFVYVVFIDAIAGISNSLFFNYWDSLGVHCMHVPYSVYLEIAGLLGRLRLRVS